MNGAPPPRPGLWPLLVPAFVALALYALAALLLSDTDPCRGNIECAMMASP